MGARRPDLRAPADHRRPARHGAADARLGGGHRRPTRRRSHRADDPPRHGSGRGGRNRRPRRRDGARRAAGERGRGGAGRPRRPRTPGAKAARGVGGLGRVAEALLSCHDGVLGAAFFARDVNEVAHDLVGATLLVDGVGGTLVEVEAYDHDDPAAHGYSGRTARNASMFGPPGHAYVYRSYGLHWCLNLVCGDEGVPAAVLLRALEPTVGLDEMRRRRGLEDVRLLCSGPGRLCEALDVTRDHDGLSLAEPPFELRAPESPVGVAVAPRIGISKAAELPWRYVLRGSRFVSRGLPRAAP